MSPSSDEGTYTVVLFIYIIRCGPVGLSVQLYNYTAIQLYNNPTSLEYSWVEHVYANTYTLEVKN